MTLPFELLTFKLVCINIVLNLGMGNLPTNSALSWTFRSRLMAYGTTPVTRPRHHDFYLLK